MLGREYQSNKKLMIDAVVFYTMAYTSGLQNLMMRKGTKFKLSAWSEPEDDPLQIWIANEDLFVEDNVELKSYVDSPKYDGFCGMIRKADLMSNCSDLTDFSNAVYFYSSQEENGYLSNFSYHGFTLDEKYYKTVEHFFQAQKFEDEAMVKRIIDAESPKKASELGRSRSAKLRADWEEVKTDLMQRAVMAKFEQHKNLKSMLLETGDRFIIENSPFDEFWGIGKLGNGHNQLGFVLMRVRELLRQN